MVQFFFKVLFFSKKLKDKPNIIYASSPHPFNGLAGMYLARKYKCPFILEIRDLWPETWVAMGATTKKSIFMISMFAFLFAVFFMALKRSVFSKSINRSQSNECNRVK